MIRRGRKTDLSDEQLLAMGEIAYWAARVERTLGLVVAGLVNKDSEAGQLVTNGMAFQNLLVLGTRLVSLRAPEDRARVLYTKLAGPLKTAMEERHHVLHSSWTRPRPHGPVSATLTRAKGSVEREFTIEEIESVANDLAALDDRLFLLHLGVNDIVEWMMD